MSSRVWCSVVSLDYRFLKAFMTPNSTGRVVFTVIHPKPNKTDRHIKRFKILELEVNNFYFRKFKPFVARTVVLMRKIFFSLCREKWSSAFITKNLHIYGVVFHCLATDVKHLAEILITTILSHIVNQNRGKTGADIDYITAWDI